LAEDYGYFLSFLDSDQVILAYARQKPELWTELKRSLVTMTWKTYWERWYTLYRPRLSSLQWIRAAFYMPFIPAYYAAVLSIFFETSRGAIGSRVKNRLPWAYKLYQTFKHGTS